VRGGTNRLKEPKESSGVRGNAAVVVATVVAENGEEIATGSRVNRPKEGRRAQGSRKENTRRLKRETLFLVKKENRVRGLRRGPNPSNLVGTVIDVGAAADETAGGIGRRREKPVAEMRLTNRLNARAASQPELPRQLTERPLRLRGVSHEPLPNPGVSHEGENRRHRSR
jgi:hypothetical protein